MSKKALAAIESHPAFKAASTLLLYHSLNDEVDTRDFIRKWHATKHIILPAVVGDELELRPYAPGQLKPGAYGIEEPCHMPPFRNYEEIDLAIVPGVAFDKQGNRLGRGKGYYDRLLPLLPHAFKIGLCFPFQLVDEIPTEPFDIPMDLIITTNNED